MNLQFLITHISSTLKFTLMSLCTAVERKMILQLNAAFCYAKHQFLHARLLVYFSKKIGCQGQACKDSGSCCQIKAMSKISCYCHIYYSLWRLTYSFGVLMVLELFRDDLWNMDELWAIISSQHYHSSCKLRNYMLLVKFSL